MVNEELIEVTGVGPGQPELPGAKEHALGKLWGAKAHGFVQEDGRGAVGEGVVLLKFATGEVVEASESKGLFQFVGALAALVEVLEVALLYGAFLADAVDEEFEGVLGGETGVFVPLVGVVGDNCCARRTTIENKVGE